MIPELICVALILYELYIRKKYNESCGKNFIIFIGLLLVSLVWESLSLNYLELSTGVRKIETIVIVFVRAVVTIFLGIGFAKAIIIPYLNRFRKKKND